MLARATKLGGGPSLVDRSNPTVKSGRSVGIFSPAKWCALVKIDHICSEEADAARPAYGKKMRQKVHLGAHAADARTASIKKDQDRQREGEQRRTQSGNAKKDALYQ